MHIADASPERASSDLTARARIRDAAIECFAEEGFGASFRTIAGRAEVSPGLITHHFGAKETLREECDAEVLRRYRELKMDAVADPGGYLVQRLAAPGGAPIVLVYMLRAIHAGGDPAGTFLESLIDDGRQVMAEAVRTGVIRPSHDEEARLRYLTYQTMGSMLVQFLLQPTLTPDEFVATMHAGGRDTIRPVLELYTDGLLTNRQMLEDYLDNLQQPPT